MKPRAFFRGAAALAAASLLCAAAPPQEAEPIRFAVVADVHQDVMHDGEQRVEAFVGDARGFDASFVVQLGDFCRPDEGNRAFADAFEAFPGDVHHVLGNHEVDGGFAWGDVTEFLGMEARYRSFDAGGVRFLLLDGNEKNPAGGPPGYPRHLGAEQLAWVADELESSPLPLVLFSHQGPTPDHGLDNGDEVRALLRAAPPGRVLAWIHGHDHTDRVRWLEGIPVWSVNSASYYWVGDAYAHSSYGKAVEKDHPWIARTCPYRDALWGKVELDLAAGELRILGRATEWVGPAPQALDGWSNPPGLYGVRPEIASRTLTLPRAGMRRYRSVELRGFWVQIEEALDAEAELRDQVLALFDAKLGEVTSRLAPEVAALLCEVPFWLHLEREGVPGGVYHPSRNWLVEHELDSRWARGVEFGNARNFLSWSEVQPSMVLHELAHAWHDRVLDYDDAAIREAFRRAQKAGNYEDVPCAGGGRRKAYALENEREFFAETSEAYWGRNDFYPFDRDDLLEHDPETAALLEEAWRAPR